ncbi:ribosomal protein S5 family protein [Wolffia australiana]
MASTSRIINLWRVSRTRAMYRISNHSTISSSVVGSISSHFLSSPSTQFSFHRHFSVSPAQADRIIRDMLAEVEREKQRERDVKRRAGNAVDEEEEEEDFMGVGPLIEKWEKRVAKDPGEDPSWEIPTDSDSEDDERFSPQEVKRRFEEFEKKHSRHKELLHKFAEAATLDEAHKWMSRIDKFEQKYLSLPLEYRVIGDLMNRLKNATEKEKFILQQKLNRALRLMDCKEAYDPNNPANYGAIKHSQVGPSVDQLKYTDFQKEKKMIQGGDLDDDNENDDFSEMKEEDEKLLQKFNDLDKKLEEKLAELEHTFGKKGRALEEEIKELADERSALTEKSKRPLYRKGFDVKVIDVNRTCKVTKGGQLTKYTALLACGNFNGVIGFAKAKGPTPRISIQKAYEKCFQNLHYVERHEEHTIAHAVQTKYEKTKIYLWPASTRSGVVGASKTVETILFLAGYKNVKSKVIGSRNPHNTIKALFKGLNAIQTPKDVQEKFGRTVVESYLL